ncbi:MAG: hypothetical protein GY832_31800 [Chloroflexi bacterium]|nr:hypothetical protein [Chloroflexota bacterium]
MRKWLQEALETLWSVSGLANNPLVDSLELAKGERDSFGRAIALRNAILQGAQMLKQNGEKNHFDVLNSAYGLEVEMQRRYRLSVARPSRAELAAQARLTPEEYTQQLAQAITQLEIQIRNP